MRRFLPALGVFAMKSALGCAPVAPLPPAVAELPLEPWERATASAAPTPAAETPTPVVNERADEELAKRGPKSPKGVERSEPGAPPGGSACLGALAERGVKFSKSEPVLGVATPVVVEGPIGGVSFYSHERKPFVTDCRLALALVDVAEELRALGVSKVRYSGAYVYRTSHPGRMSMHAYGLAIDLHAFTIGSETLEVKSHFERGQGTRCTSGMAALNLVACRVRALGSFKEQIGPDDNRAHYDHFHFGLKPLPGEVAADLPWPAPPPRALRAKRGRRR